ncbi:E3 ubiquitin-protein ligase RNF168-like [Trichosurus vulpecula]|uniref:E3 ubiquitin-protein ligase RNF168-like n=1 Tax=Trichosurus vulpecula TaxID=9337 RepID=UPI00186B35DD|nr:E3 ubiquitin-protein ligase RNF168-like [Trichosurus vulpecula]
MATAPEAPLELSDCLCPICTEILVEPVSLPCGHTLCHSCFQQTVQKASLYCPFCRRRLSSWARAQARQKTLINHKLWRRIEKLYLRKGGLAGRGGRIKRQELDADLPPRRLSAPGELRREYEEELSKVEAERRAFSEEEARVSAEYIHQLLAEEEEEEHRREEEEVGSQRPGQEEEGKLRLELEQKENLEKLKDQRSKQEETQTREKGKRPRYEEDWRQSREDRESPRQAEEERQKEREAQLKIDKELAQEISISFKTLKCVLTSLFVANSSYSAPCRSPKKTESKPNNARDIHKCMTPRSPLTSPALQNELGATGDKRCCKCKEVSIGKGKSTRWQGERKDLPTLSTQAFCEIENIGARASLEDGVKTCIRGESKPGTSCEDKIISRCIVENHQLPKTKFFCSWAAVAKPSGKSENECTGEMTNESTSLLVNKEILGRKSLQSLSESLSDSGFSSKKRNICAEPTPEKDQRKSTFTQKLIDLEHLFFERHKQEEEDRLLALQLQGEMNREQKLNRKKRTRDEYLLRPRVTLNSDKRRMVCSKSLKKKKLKRHFQSL